MPQLSGNEPILGLNRTLQISGSPPSLITHEDPFTYQPGESFNLGPVSRSWFSGPVKSKYCIGFGGS
jgi:hypothetical protein